MALLRLMRFVSVDIYNYYLYSRWAGSSASASGMSMSRGGPMGSGSGMFGSGASYSDTISSMGMMGLSSGASYNDRFDAYKSNIRKY